MDMIQQDHIGIGIGMILIDGECENEQLDDELGGLTIGEGGLGDGPEMSISQCDLTDQNANLYNDFGNIGAEVFGNGESERTQAEGTGGGGGEDRWRW